MLEDFYFRIKLTQLHIHLKAKFNFNINLKMRLFVFHPESEHNNNNWRRTHIRQRLWRIRSYTKPFVHSRLEDRQLPAKRWWPLCSQMNSPLWSCQSTEKQKKKKLISCFSCMNLNSVIEFKVELRLNRLSLTVTVSVQQMNHVMWPKPLLEKDKTIDLGISYGAVNMCLHSTGEELPVQDVLML